MGNFEKLVVLTVLFLVATILGISMHEGEGDLSNDPTGTTEVEKPAKDKASGNASGLTASSTVELDKPHKGEKKAPSVGTREANAKKNSTPKVAPKVEVQKQPVVPKTNGAQGILLTMEGLTAAPGSDDYMMYTLQPGESITVIANRFYGDLSFRSRLRGDNEGVSFVPGARIMLARYDFGAGAGVREALKPAPVHAAPKTTVKPKSTKVTEYTVVEGDSLWSISFEAYGKGAQWGEIYKANQDRMANENDLKVGMVLRIPAL